MTIKQCDRCGKTYNLTSKERKNTDHQLTGTYEYGTYGPIKFHIDLCPECAERFDEWMNEDKEIKYTRW